MMFSHLRAKRGCLVDEARTDQQGMGASVCLAKTSSSGFLLRKFVHCDYAGVRAAGISGDHSLVTWVTRGLGGVVRGHAGVEKPPPCIVSISSHSWRQRGPQFSFI